MRGAAAAAAASARPTGRLLAPALALTALVGCVPFAVPPAQFEVGTGVERVHDREGRITQEVPVQVRGAFHPLQLSEAYPVRPVDVGVGGFFDYASSYSERGLYADIEAFPLRQPLGSGVLRVGPRAQLRLLYDPPTHAYGQGLALQVALDYVGYSEGPFNSDNADSGAFGYLSGASGIGVYLEGAVSEIHGERIGSVSLGILVRIPGMIGIAWGIPR